MKLDNLIIFLSQSGFLVLKDNFNGIKFLNIFLPMKLSFLKKQTKYFHKLNFFEQFFLSVIAPLKNFI